MNVRLIASFLSLTVILGASGAMPMPAIADNLSTKANIYLYPNPSQVADLVLQDMNGRRVSLSDYRGKVVLLHFWSIRCPACRSEEPALHWLKKKMGPAGLEILGVNLSDPPDAVCGYAETHKTPFPVLTSPDQGYRLQMVAMGGTKTAFVINPQKQAILEVPGVPTTYIIDCRGNAVGFSVGPARWNQADAQAFLQELISRRTCQAGSAQTREERRLSLR